MSNLIFVVKPALGADVRECINEAKAWCQFTAKKVELDFNGVKIIVHAGSKTDVLVDKYMSVHPGEAIE